MRLAAVLVTVIVLAGCSDDAPGTQGGGQDQEQALEDLGLKATDTTGIIRGVVVNEAIVPLGGVNITAVSTGAEVTTQTNDEGLFGLEGLAPGTYFVSASKTGYTTVQTSAEVVA